MGSAAWATYHEIGIPNNSRDMKPRRPMSAEDLRNLLTVARMIAVFMDSRSPLNQASLGEPSVNLWFYPVFVTLTLAGSRAWCCINSQLAIMITPIVCARP